MKIRLLLLIVTLQLTIFNSSKAQFNALGDVILLPQPQNNYGSPLILNLPENNLVAFRQEDQWGNILTFRKYDQNLKQQWMYKYVIPISHVIKNIYYDKVKSLYILSQSFGKMKEVSLTKIDLEDGKQEFIQAELPLLAEVSQVKVLGNFAFIIALHRERTIVLKLDLADQSVIVLPSMYDRKFELLSYYEDDFSNLMFFAMKEKRSCDFQLRTYSQVLGFMPSLDLKFRGDYTFLESVIYPVSRDEKLLFSAFSLKCSDRTQGIAVTRLSNQKKDPITAYYRFTNYVNYFDHFREKKAERYRERVRKKRAKGKEYRLRNYTLLQEEPKEVNDEVILVAEGYSIEFQSIGEGERIFDGYNTYHATLIGFDKKGKKLWDNSMKLRGIKQKSLNEILHVGNYGDSIILAYLEDNSIHSKMIHRYSVVKEETKQPLKDLLANPKISNYNHELMHWYDNVFLVWGLYYANTLDKPIYYLQRLEYIPMPDMVENN